VKVTIIIQINQLIKTSNHSSSPEAFSSSLPSSSSASVSFFVFFVGLAATFFAGAGLAFPPASEEAAVLSSFFSLSYLSLSSAAFFSHFSLVFASRFFQSSPVYFAI
jgi:hypothetical protein